MAVVETRMSVWEALAGRAPGQPLGPADPGMWAAVVERLNPARAKPMLRDGHRAGRPRLASAASLRHAPLARRSRRRLLPAVDPAGVAARPADGRHAHGGPAGRRVRAHRRPARARPGHPGRRRPGRQPDARRAAPRRVPTRWADVHRRPWPARFGKRAARVRPGPPYRPGRRRPPRRRSSTAPAASCCSPGSSRCCSRSSRCAVSARSSGPGGAAPSRSSSPTGRTPSARPSCSASTWSRWPATSSGTRSRPNTPADGCPPPGSSSTSASRRCSSTPPTCGWPAAAPA